MAAAVVVDVLPASRGDSLLVECARDGRRPWRLLVDGGMPDSVGGLRARLVELPADDRRVDLAVVSHVDADHIGGLLALLSMPDPGVEIGEVWFNGLPQLPDEQGRTRSVQQGESLVQVLGGVGASAPPWNTTFGGAAVCTAPDGTPPVVQIPDGPTITVLGPPPARLARLRTVWIAEQQRVERGEPSEDEEPPAPPARLDDLPALAATKTAQDASVANGSSIALLVEHRGAGVLLAADAFVPDLRAGLTAVARSRGTDTVPVDVFKLSHHGSRGNVSRALLALAPADHYVVSTNGDRFHHPDDIAMARVITAGTPGLTLWFNYDTTANRRWADPALVARHGHSVRFPTAGGQGVRIELAAR